MFSIARKPQNPSPKARYKFAVDTPRPPKHGEYGLPGKWCLKSLYYSSVQNLNLPDRAEGEQSASNRYAVRDAFGGLPAALVINLRRGDVPVAEQLLHLADVFAVLQKQGGGRGPRRVRRLAIASPFLEGARLGQL
jgi:hypothetical protein